MPNKTIGKIKCPFCSNKEAEVRRYQTGKKLLYFLCRNDGMITPNYPKGQEYMLENAEIFGAGAVNDPEPPEEIPEKSEEKTVNGNPPVNEDEKPPKKNAWQSFWSDDE